MTTMIDADAREEAGRWAAGVEQMLIRLGLVRRIQPMGAGVQVWDKTELRPRDTAISDWVPEQTLDTLHRLSMVEASDAEIEQALAGMKTAACTGRIQQAAGFLAVPGTGTLYEGPPGAGPMLAALAKMDAETAAAIVAQFSAQ